MHHLPPIRQIDPKVPSSRTPTTPSSLQRPIRLLPTSKLHAHPPALLDERLLDLPRHLLGRIPRTRRRERQGYRDSMDMRVPQPARDLIKDRRVLVLGEERAEGGFVLDGLLEDPLPEVSRDRRVARVVRYGDDEDVPAAWNVGAVTLRLRV